ncbi:glutamine amidotransferase [Meridianimarinicoccus roseus]|uniref:Glutamine amidotransferase n=1 Tax=Meridianimarinicoccus roseus TaxID=2072018 RepID=A0A2V2LFK5_9RHOB|nr:type 1 glutamine amidotransferase [Meridianimarinicoccus roseus]PWR04225.1 glutamine amidotransferase [Meridianimarinicoccus roseus]
MHIGILECGPTPVEIAERHGTYPQLFARLLDAPGRTFASWCVHGMEFPPGGSADADAWLLTGSRHGCYDPLPFIAPLEAFIRAARAAGRPMAGICFGHQVMAQALGGRVEKSKRGWGFGRQVYDMGDAGEMAVTAIHQDQVVRAPQGAEVIARNAFCPIAGLRYGNWGLSVQPHPEFGPRISADFVELKARDASFPQALIAPARADLAAPLDDGRMMAMIADFFEAALGHPSRPAAPATRDAAPAPRQGQVSNG